MQYLLIATPGDRRERLFGQALERLGLPPARVVAWSVVAQQEALVLPAGDVLRLDSPGDDEQTRRWLLALGASEMGGSRAEQISRESALNTSNDGSGLRYPLQQQRGFEIALRRVATALVAAGIPATTPPEDVVLMSDKQACHQHFTKAGLPVPSPLPADSTEALREGMRRAGVDRAFVKLRYGSSAAGMAAYDQRAGTLTTSLRFDGEAPYSSLRLQTLRDPAAIERALTWLTSEGAHAETWLQKQTHNGSEYDLRAVVIAGEVRQVVVRVARRGNPMTDLHLGNARGDLGAVQAALGEATWAQTRAVCEAAAACFPRTLSAGVDVALVPGQGPVLLEINAFGDLLPGVLDRGEDTYEAQLRAYSSKKGSA